MDGGGALLITGASPVSWSATTQIGRRKELWMANYDQSEMDIEEMRGVSPGYFTLVSCGGNLEDDHERVSFL